MITLEFDLDDSGRVTRSALEAHPLDGADPWLALADTQVLDVPSDHTEEVNRRVAARGARARSGSLGLLALRTAVGRLVGAR
jgi:hypothetical protein